MVMSLKGYLSAVPEALETHRRQAFQALIERINLNAERLQGGHAQQWFGVRPAEDERSADKLPHELYPPHRDIP